MSQLQQPDNILNKVSTLFGRKKNETLERELTDSLFGEDRALSRVDSLYSSIHSRRSVSIAQGPPPVRTVRLENTITHLPTQDAVDEEFEKLLKEYAPAADRHVSNLTHEQKQALLQCSKSPATIKKNTFSLNTLFKRPSLNEALYQPSLESNTAQFKTSPARYGKTSRASVLPDTAPRQRSKVKSTPEYFVHMLNATHVRDLPDSEVLELRVFLRNVVASWTTGFLTEGGYEAIAKLLKEMKEAPKRDPKDDRMLQHLGVCLKTIMTHQAMGTQIVLGNPIALYHIRDILFGPQNKKHKQIYGLDISTRSLLLNLMCTLAMLQTPRTSDVPYVHGYDVLRRLLLNTPQEFEDKPAAPFHMSLKTDPQEILQMIMQNDPNGAVIGRECAWDALQPRYTAWMKELQYTTERHIESITFLSQLLQYDFNSFRQMDLAKPAEESTGDVMAEEGVVDYIITHLRLMRTVVTTQPTSYTGLYDEKEQEKMRLELMLSGFDKISKMLLHCPHPAIRSAYISYLKPLMHPCTDTVEDKPPALPARTHFPTRHRIHSLRVTNDDNDGVSIYADDTTEEVELDLETRPPASPEEPYDDIFQDDEFLEDHFNSDNESDLSSDPLSDYSLQPQP